jgi:predicted RNA-binding protein YlxR (DUF448 family)
MCVACRQTREKHDLVRIVRVADDDVAVDETGRLQGRGAYICRSQECWERALGGKGLDRALKMSMNEERKLTLKEYGRERFADASQGEPCGSRGMQ